MNIFKKVLLVLVLTVIALGTSLAQIEEDFRKLTIGVITHSPSDSFPDKVGENIRASRLGSWRMYKQNSLTYKEKKIRSFWVRTLYHGSWYHRPGYQPPKDGFHLVNDFGVWEHDPEKDHLIFKFIWPHNVYSKYDPCNNCYWGIHNNNTNGMKSLLYFTIDEQYTPKNVRIYEVPFEEYLYTDKEGALWFDDYEGILSKEGLLEIRKNVYNRTSDLTCQQSQQKASVYYRMRKYSLQEYKMDRWNGSSLVSGTVRSVDQRDNVVLVGCNGGAFECYPDYGITFKINNWFTEWVRFDKEGRKWLATNDLFCLDNTDIKVPTYEEFVALLPHVMSKDPVIATEAMRQLLQVGDFYESWIAENTYHEDKRIKQAAENLNECIKGKRKLEFSGDVSDLERLYNGEGTSPDLLPIPEQNKEKPFIEEDPLVLDTSASGTLKNLRLVEIPLFDHPQYYFYGPASIMVGRNTISANYIRVKRIDDSLEFIFKKAPGDIWDVSSQNNPSEVLALITSSEDENTSLIGKMEVDSGEFHKFGNLPIIRSKGQMAMDPQDRILYMGTDIYYQKEKYGKFTSSKVNIPMVSSGCSIVTSHDGNRIFCYRTLYERQWEGMFTEIYEFVDGQLRPIHKSLPGHIYKMTYLTEDILLAATKDPRKLLFIDCASGKVINDIFALKDSQDRNFFYISGIQDNHGKFWFFTISPDYKEKKGISRIQTWDGKVFSTLLKWQNDDHISNPYTGNMCATENGLIWVGLTGKMLIIDSKSLNYRFFRVHDRQRIPELMSIDDSWIAAHYYESKTTFHLVDASLPQTENPHF